jgi:hypothetical protein
MRAIGIICGRKWVCIENRLARVRSCVLLSQGRWDSEAIWNRAITDFYFRFFRSSEAIIGGTNM